MNLSPLDPLPSRSPPDFELDLTNDFISKFRGPIRGSNWAIPNRILMSQYPGCSDQDQAQKRAQLLINSGIRVFVCLQEIMELSMFRSYKDDVLKYAPDAQFIHFEIPDMFIQDDKKVEEFTSKLLKIVAEHNILIHCHGGHGRTGTISAILLGKLYNLSAKESLRRIGAYHKTRLPKPYQSAPQTNAQIEQVIKILSQ